MSTDPVLEAAGDAIVIVDASGTITSWNRAATELLGHPSPTPLLPR